MALSKKPVAATTSDPSTTTDSTSAADSQEAVAARFTSLLTVADNAKIKEEFNTEGIKGRVQDRNSAIELEPYFAPSYYITTSELREEPYFVKELDDINATRLLRFGLMITNHEPPLDDEDIINSHFKSIEYYNSYIPTHTPRAIDYFGRAMDYVTLHNYRAALTDLDQAITLAPDFTAAYLMRAITCLRNNQANSPDAVADAAIASKMAYQQAMADLDKVIQLSPRMAIAHYNKGILLASATPSPDFTSAISSFTNAIELKPDMGEAYYNRGYLYLRLGNRQAGVADLSKAGELGIVASYNLLKRMTQ